MGQCNFLHLWHQKWYRAFRFGTLWPISCSYPRHSQLTRHSLMLANGRIRQSLTALVSITGHYNGGKWLIHGTNTTRTTNSKAQTTPAWMLVMGPKSTSLVKSKVGGQKHSWRDILTNEWTWVVDNFVAPAEPSGTYISCTVCCKNYMQGFHFDVF